MLDRLTLRGAAWLLIGGFVLHNADHARRGLDVVDEGIVWAGTLLLVLAAIALTLVFTGHERAPLAAAILGPTIVVGVAAAHLPPEWGPLSDPLITGDAGIVTFVAVASEIVAGALFGWVGWRILQHHEYDLAVPQPAW